MFFKIGEFSRLTGISVDTLRYYERCGLLTPRVDEANSYRLYTEQDFLALFHLRQLRGLELPLAEIKEYRAEGCSLEEQLEGLTDRCARIDEELHRLQLLRQRCAAAARMIHKVKENLGKVAEVNCTAAYHLLFCTLEHLPPERVAPLVEKWVSAMPFVGYFVSLAPEELGSAPQALKFGLSADLRYVGEFGLPIVPPVKAMKGGAGVQYTLAVEDVFSLTEREMKPALDYAARNHFVILDDVCFAVDAVEMRKNAPPLYYLNMRFPVKYL